MLCGEEEVGREGEAEFGVGGGEEVAEDDDGEGGAVDFLLVQFFEGFFGEIFLFFVGETLKAVNGFGEGGFGGVSVENGGDGIPPDQFLQEPEHCGWAGNLIIIEKMEAK